MVLVLGAGKQDDSGVRGRRGPGEPVQGGQQRPGQCMLDVHALRVVALVVVDGQQRGAADEFPGVDHAAPGEEAVQQGAAPFAIQGPGGGNEVSHVAGRLDRGGFPAPTRRAASEASMPRLISSTIRRSRMTSSSW